MMVRVILAGSALVAGTATIAVAARHLAKGDAIVVVQAVPDPSTLVTDPVVLLSGWRDGTCRAFEVVSGLADVGDASQPGTPDCPHRVVAFATGFRPAFVASPVWVAAPSGGNELTVAVHSPVQVGIRSWIVTDEATWDAAKQHAKASFGLAAQVLERDRTGIALVDVGISVLPQTGGPFIGTLGGGCGRIDALRADPGSYAAGQVNVYYVAILTYPETSTGIDRSEVKAPLRSGQNCGPYGAPEIIFVEQDKGKYLLVHELGHLFGSWEPLGGHVELDNNFLLPGGASDGGVVTLGQAFRMQFDTRSWLNLGASLGADPATFLRNPVLTCQTEPRDWPCPRVGATP